ncbi:MAG: stage II sporulation protein D [Evtepia sp.]
MTRKMIVTALALTLLLFFLPSILQGQTEKTDLNAACPPAQTEEQTIRVLLDESVTTMPLNEYICSVVAAEMPARFEIEALKAQAVAARTYALRRSGAHSNADICGNPACCQAYIDLATAAKNWGPDAEKNTKKIRDAVYATKSEVIRYQGELITAVFHSSSSGFTQDAVQVWGGDVPYLVSVESPEGQEVPNFTTKTTLPAAQFRDVFLGEFPTANLSGSPTTWFGNANKSAGGSVTSMIIGGVSVKGSKLRSLFTLRSTTFHIFPGETEIVFEVSGYGHGVGMSQYGANAMAQDGKSYLDILKWYYSGVTIEPFA